MPLEIRLIKDSEYPAVNDFFNNALNIKRPAKATTRKYDEFCWEFLNGPCGKAIYAAALEVDEGKEPTIVGIQCVIPLKMISSGGQLFLTAKGEDTLVDLNAQLKYKKTDILKELYGLLFEECRKAGIQMVWGFNNMYATNKRMGFEHVVKSFYGVLVLKPVGAYKNIVIHKPEIGVIEKCRIASLSFMSFLFSLKKNFFISKQKNFDSNVEINDNVDLFQRATVPDNLIFLLQDKDYLSWRISANPYPVKYRSYQLSDNENTMQAQIICSIKNREAFIEQTLFDKKLNRKTIYFLLKKAMESLKKENICLVRYIGFKNNFLNKMEMDRMKNIGFVFAKKGEQVCFVNLVNDPVINPENVYLSRLYKQGID